MSLVSEQPHCRLGFRHRWTQRLSSIRKTIFSVKVYATLLDYLKFLRSPSQVLALFKGFLFLLPDSCTAPLPTKIAHQTVCPNPSPKPFSQSRKTVQLWPGQTPGEGQVQLHKGYKERPLSAILCLCVCSAGVSTCLHPFDQKKSPCQDFLCLSCVCFQDYRVFNSNSGVVEDLVGLFLFPYVDLVQAGSSLLLAKGWSATGKYRLPGSNLVTVRTYFLDC
jgi:hypothetical protein